MYLYSQISVGFVALQHIIFLILEMFFWSKPIGIKMFKLDPDFAKASAFLAKNQGLYNGFLAAGLIWSLITPDLILAQQLQTFFLSCIVVAGIYGAITASIGILFIQALPAGVALLIMFFRT